MLLAWISHMKTVNQQQASIVRWGGKQFITNTNAKVLFNCVNARIGQLRHSYDKNIPFLVWFLQRWSIAEGFGYFLGRYKEPAIFPASSAMTGTYVFHLKTGMSLLLNRNSRESDSLGAKQFVMTGEICSVKTKPYQLGFWRYWMRICTWHDGS